jgi:putative heme-binding domain-containing protein
MGFGDKSAAVRANAIRISERYLGGKREVAPDCDLLLLLNLVKDPEITVRYQLALSLGECKDPRAGEGLAQLATRDMSDPWMRAAIISSATRHFAVILKSVLAADKSAPGRSEMITQLIATAAGEGTRESLEETIALVSPGEHSREAWQLSALVSLLDALDRKGIPLASLENSMRRMGPLFAWASEMSASDTKDPLRESAIRLLGRNPERQEEDLKILVASVDQPNSARAQAAVIESVKRTRNSELPALLLRDWARRAPSPRQSCIEIMMTRDEWAKALLKAISEKIIVPTEIAPETRQRFLTHRNAEIQKQAGEVFKGGGSRKEILAKYQVVTTISGDASHGSEVFAKNCATCHLLRGQGHNVGPNLAALTDKTAGDFLLAILDPNAVVEPRYVAYDIETKDDRSLNGIVSAETGTTLTLTQGGGAQDQILRGDIASMRASGLSLMPEGFEQNIPPEQMADLIAFLKNAGPAPFGSATAEQASNARKKFFEGGANGVTKVLSAAEQLPYPSWLGSQPLAHCRQTDGRSKLSWQSAVVPTDLKPGDVFKFRLPVALGFTSQPAGKFSLALNGKAAFDFDVTLADKTWESADGKVRASYIVMEANEEDSDGVLLIEVAGALLEPGKPATFEVIGSAANSLRWFGVYLVSNKRLTAAGLPDASSLVDAVLDDASPAKEREAIISSHRELAGDFLKALTGNLNSSEQEYRRIPWIWRVAIAAGKRNDTSEMSRILELTLPKANEPLHDWQAVVVGGGIINGISLVGVWPKERIEEILKGKDDLLSRWQRAMDLASAMADDEKVKTGTRYDALRMVAMASWEARGQQLVNYLAKGVNTELQQGAISGLSDMKSPEVAPALVSGLGHYSKSNREFALDALLRDEIRISVLLDQLAAGRVAKTELGKQRLEKLGKVGDTKIRARVKELVAN